MCPNGVDFLEVWLSTNVTFRGEKTGWKPASTLAKKLICDAVVHEIPLSDMGFDDDYTPEMHISKAMTYTRDQMFP